MRILRFSSVILVIWIVLLFLFISLSFLPRIFNSDSIRSNVISSLETLDREGVYPRFIIGGQFLQKDNFTDAIMVGNTICTTDSLSTLENALLVPMYSFDHDKEETPAKSALVSLKEESSSNVDHYGRYWHGYLLTLKSVLAITDLKGIRFINAILLYLLSILNCFLLWRKCGKSIAILFFISLLCVSIITVPLSLQFFTCFFLMEVALLFFLCVRKRWLSTPNVGLFFFIIGSLTSYFDFLTTPLITLAVPLSVVLIRRNRFPDISTLSLTCAMWGLGYVGLWASKWFIANAFTSYDILGNAFSTVGVRSSTVFDNEVLGHSVRLFLGCFIGLLMVFIISLKILNSLRPYSMMKLYYPFAILAWLPFVWILAFQNHSLGHNWFVWRIMIVFIFNISLFYYYSFNKFPR